MAVFRVERNKGYTVMSNHHLRNKELTLKAKGLLSQMLSLPEDWDYTLAGLSQINREKIDAIREAIKELERAGYIVRSRERDEKGRLRGADYVIFEQPQPPTPDLPTLENPTLDNPTQEKPTLEKPTLENPTQLNKDIQRTDLPKKEKSNTDLSSTHSIPILSPNPSPCREAATPPERKGTEATAQSAVDIYREIIKDNIDYHILKQDMKFDSDRLDEIVDLMLETVCTARKRVRIAGDDYPAELVKSKFMKLDGEHIRFVLDCMRENTTKIRNIKKNHGSMTPGTDGKTITELATLSDEQLISSVQHKLDWYVPQSVRRVEIPKGNDPTKKRPLGIPTIMDRLIQQCVLQVMEPICEAKFHDHSYGFRPNRNQQHAIAQVHKDMQRSNLHYVVDIDIKGFFDNVNHGKLLKQLWTMGIHDKKLLCILSAMLKAEVAGIGFPEVGTPQGGIISPLLSNVVLNELDWWLASQWEE